MRSAPVASFAIAVVIAMGIGTSAVVVAACDSLYGEEESPPSTVDGGAGDAPSNPDPIEPEGTPPILLDGGCLDAAFEESFSQSSFTALWTTATSASGAAVEIDNAVGAPAAPSLRANVDSLGEGHAHATRRVCPPSSGVIACSFMLRIDSTTSGDLGIFDLSGGKGPSGAVAVARLKGREILFLTNDDGGQTAVRTPAPLVDLVTADGAKFHFVEVEITASEYLLKVDGLTQATLPLPTQGLSLDRVRAGVLYATGERSPGWDIHIDDLRCSFR